jgi:hypothetical protein
LPSGAPSASVYVEARPRSASARATPVPPGRLLLNVNAPASAVRISSLLRLWAMYRPIFSVWLPRIHVRLSLIV